MKFTPTEGYTGMLTQVPCGQCSGCRLEHSRGWACRIMAEAQMHAHNSFITLTYDDEHLVDPSLDVRDWQLFAKKFRNTLGPFRFYHCGEYGELNNRKHLHACIFGHDFHEDRKPLKMSGEYQLYVSKTLNDLWEHGHANIGELTFNSAAYVARYCLKKINGQAQDGRTVINRHTGEVLNLKPEYSTMSRRPGIGRRWIEKYHKDVYPDDFVVQANGTKTKPPKYFDEYLEEEQVDKFDQVKAARKKSGIAHREHSTPERLAVRETVLEARQKIFTHRG